MILLFLFLQCTTLEWISERLVLRCGLMLSMLLNILLGELDVIR